jgi:hypothetical protein
VRPWTVVVGHASEAVPSASPSGGRLQ